MNSVIEFLSFDDWYAKEEHKSEGWIIVARSQKLGNSDFRTFSVLASADEGNLEKILSSEDWDIIRLGTPMEFGRPYVESSNNGTMKYNSGQNAIIDGIEFKPFTLFHTYHGYIPNQFELVQNFILFTNAFFDSQTDEFVTINDVGELESVARYESDDDGNMVILVDAHILKNYLAANRSYLVRYHDHRRWATDDIKDQIQGEYKKIPIVHSDSRYELLLRTEHDWDDKKSASRLLGKDIIRPYAELDDQYRHHFTGLLEKKYTTFIIGRNDKGEEIEASCNEEVLQNVSIEQEANFFTHVYFQQDLIDKYKVAPLRYIVEDRFVSCLDLWSIAIDMTEEGFVRAKLGELGRIPYKEQKYWRQFNVAPRVGPTVPRLKHSASREIIEPVHYEEVSTTHVERVSFSKALRLILQAGKDMERRASTYSKLGENTLRDILLTSLNTNFDGLATGETFSRSGKTDIYVPLRNRKPLVAECKIWDGLIYYQKAIIQLFGYLTVKDDEGIIITFFMGGNFTSKTNKAQEAIETDPTYISQSFKKIDSVIAYATAEHKHPSDPLKICKIHHLFIALV